MSVDDTTSLVDEGPDSSPAATSRAGESAELAIAPGDALGRYTIRARLGGGGMGQVFAAEDPELDRVVALKVLGPDRSVPSPEARVRFQREAQAMARLNHPNVVTVYDVGTLGERAFIAMELVSGPTLAAWLAERHRGWREVLGVFVQAGRGLAAAHAAGLVHRDFKPSNVLIGDRVRVADFGLARAAIEPGQVTGRSPAVLDGGVVTRAGDAPGTPAYMAPEQRAGLPVGPLSDQYSFALAFHDALHGVGPGQPVPAAAPRAVPAWLRAVLERALHERPEDRYPSMRALLADLERRSARRSWRWLAAAAAVVAAGALVVLGSRRKLPDNPLADARFAPLSDSDASERSATISRDGNLVAFLSDRDGPVDVWLAHVGSGEVKNLTRGGLADLVNQEIRELQFSPDGQSVLCWVRRPDLAGASDISIWAVPVAGGAPALYLEGVAEADWSADATRLAYHTPAPGDPLFVKEAGQTAARQIFVAPAGIHGHFPTWSSDGEFIYLVRGVPPARMDVWRIRPTGGAPERLTFHDSLVSDPTPLDPGTLLYLATGEDGSGPWLYGLDLERRTSRRLVFGVEQYTSLAASASGRRLVATVARPKASLWRLPIAEQAVDLSAATRIPLPTPGGHAPRYGAGNLVYVSSAGDRDALWKLAGGKGVELWSAPRERVVGGPAMSRDGRSIAFIAEKEGGARRIRVIRDDGGEGRDLAGTLALGSSLAWTPDGSALTVVAFEQGAPRLFSVPVGGGAPAPLLTAYSTDPVWSPDGDQLLYRGRQDGVTVSIEAMRPDGRPATIPRLTATLGGQHPVFMPGGRGLVVLRGDIERKDFWLIDLDSGAERRLTQLDRAVVRDFDVSADGREITFDLLNENSDVVLIELRR